MYDYVMSEYVMFMSLGMLSMFIVFCGLLGLIIYKDAEAYGMPPLKWALIAACVPNLIGVVLYLVARSKVEKELFCSNCKSPVEKDFNLCPNCACVFENTCHVCKKAVHATNEICPYCGAKPTEEKVAKTGTKLQKKTQLIKPLIAFCMCYFIFVIVTLVFFIGRSVEGYAMNLDINDMPVNIAEAGFSTISIDNSTREKIDHYFHYSTSVVSRPLNVYADETPQIDLEVAFEAGEIQIQILDENNKEIFEKTYVGELENSKAKVVKESIRVNVTKDQVYQIKFIYKKAEKGTIKIEG